MEVAIIYYINHKLKLENFTKIIPPVFSYDC